MIRIGLVGEDPNDTSSIKNLLAKRYKTKVEFCPLLKGVKGYQLDSLKVKRAVIAEWNSEKYRFIIYTRDLDAFASEKEKVKIKTDWFKELNTKTGRSNVFLLNIWELEALILADIDIFNREYHVDSRFSKDPMAIKDPKEFLMRLTQKQQKSYKVSHCPQIFSKLRLDILEKNCKYFSVFLKELDLKIS